MHVGVLTAPFRRTKKTFAEIAEWAAGEGFGALEVVTGPGGHIDPAEVLKDDGAAVKKVLADTGIAISSLAFYSGFNKGDGPEAYSNIMKDVLAAAQAVGTDCVCTLVGFPAEGKSKEATIRELAPAIYEPLAADAEKRGLTIAFENWFATNLQNMECFRAVMEALPQPNVGFNFDPSHLEWQGVDVQAAVEECKGRIFHTHAKDVTISHKRLSRLGCLDGGWWEYSIPGSGDVRWGDYIRTLRRVGYDGVLSIEHEDGAVGIEEGFVKGLRFLSTYL
ncbi:MAG: sugar phosphate isomerase/epimerase family protein [Planctomycetota bacterium]|jgi:sugar phosphate isomerase/epimerase